MLKTINAIFIIGCFITLSYEVSFAQTSKSDSLIGGIPPKSIKVGKWIKGRPIDKFEPGQVYVIDFTNTSCVPCIGLIPHFNMLSKKYTGKVNFASIYIWQNDKRSKSIGYFKKVEKFVKDLGPKINYSVAVDGPNQNTADDWLVPAGINGVPSVFIIDKNGKIVWIGTPSINGFDNILDLVVQNKFDLKEGISENRDYQIGWKEIYKSISYGSLARQLFVIDSLINRNPNNSYYNVVKFSMLIDKDEVEAYKFGRYLIAQPTIDAGILMKIAEDFRYQLAKRNLKKPDWDLIIEIRKLIYQQHSKEFKIYLSMDKAEEAKIFSLKSDFKMAILLQKESINLFEKYNDFEGVQGKDVLEKTLRQYENSLKLISN